ncbi:hypothetical protein [Telluribacter humicola]|uniref:hypothetical protein n=1 Tax=Telluribacter humicola TaxID=1720261 RepID=UPI001A96FA6D|nr:hypothetical protein [Telluribacter humicola]
MREKLHQSANKALFRFWVEADVVLIEDQKGGVPVTLDALNVFKYIEKQLGSLEGKKVIWRDLMGEWDGMGVENEVLVFYPIGCKCQEEAIQKMNRMEELGHKFDFSAEK